MFTKISVLIPTRHRVERLKNLLCSYDRTVDDDMQVELLFRIDADDYETHEFLQGRYRFVCGPRYAGYLSLPVFMNELATIALGDVFMYGNDDMVFQTEGWPGMLLEAANQFPDGLFDLGVSTLNETHFPFTIVSAKAVKRIGFFIPPRIFWGDIFWRDVMGAFGRCVMVPTVRIDHDWVGFMPDQVYRDSLVPGEITRDIERRHPNYGIEVHVPEVNDAVTKLRGLLA